MKDYLEDEVEERYYINSEKAQKLIQELIDNETLMGGDTDENLAVEKMTAQLNYKQIKKTGNEIAKTLCARDYKGFGTGFDTMNGVIECQKKF